MAECGIWSLFWWEGERVAAPPLGLGVLPGRRADADRGDCAGAVGGAAAARAQLASGRALFVANAVRGVVPVVALDGVTGRRNRGDSGALAAQFWP